MPVIHELPEPVAHYLARALRGGQRIRSAVLAQEGSIRTNPRTERWLLFDAIQSVHPGAFQFEWNARVRLAPLVRLGVKDTLASGQGSGEVRLGPFRLARSGGTPEMNQSSLHRFLAAWYPSALEPSKFLRWSAIDASRAEATLSAHGSTVSLEFRFAPTGEIAGIFTPGRWGRFDGRMQKLPWEGRFGSCSEIDGMRVPREGEVAWSIGSTWRPVWRGRLVSARYEFA